MLNEFMLNPLKAFCINYVVTPQDLVSQSAGRALMSVAMVFGNHMVNQTFRSVYVVSLRKDARHDQLFLTWLKYFHVRALFESRQGVKP